MMNKKGFSFFKLFLFISFVSLFIFLITFIFSYINKSNKITTKNDDIRMIAPTSYNPIDDIYSYSIMSYKNSNILGNSNYDSYIFNYESNALVYYISMTPNGENVSNYSSGYYPIVYDANTSNNNLLIGRDLYTAHYYQRGLTSWNGVRSWSICYNCNIPVESFNFTMFYNFPIGSTIQRPFFYIYTDVGSMRSASLQFSSTSLSSNFSSSIITSALPSATKVLRFGFAFAQSSNQNNLDNYLPTSNGTSSVTNGINYDNNNVYRNYFNSLSDVQKDNIVFISFATETYPIAYTEGYNTGFNDATNQLNNTINSLNSNILDLQSNISSLNSTINSQQLVIASLQEQLNASTNNFKGFFFTLADVPFKTVANVLGFEVFGVNLFNFFIGLVTALGLIWLVKKFI